MRIKKTLIKTLIKAPLPILVPVVDLVLVILMLLLVLLTLTGKPLGAIYQQVLAANPKENPKENQIETLRRQIQAIGRLELLAPEDVKQTEGMLPQPLDPNGNRLDNIAKLPEFLQKMHDAGNAAANLQNQAWLAYFRQQADGELAFWRKVRQGLCDPPIEPEPDFPGNTHDPVDLANFMRDLQRWKNDIWTKHEGCEKPKPFVLGEDLLHFDSGQWEVPPAGLARAMAIIRQAIDDNIAKRGHVYILGHTDPRPIAMGNEELSHRRAEFIAEQIRNYLLSVKQLKEGVDFHLYPVGMGDRQPLAQDSGEPKERLWFRLRRIEILFRSEK